MARRVSLIVTVSESARQDILHYLKVPPERVRVVYEGIGPQFRAQMQRGQPDPDAVRRRYGLHFPYILTVGTLEPRKNHRRLIQAFSWLVEQERLPHHLVIVGAGGWKGRSLQAEASKSPVASCIHYLGYVPAVDLPGLYHAADAFAFPSLYEGFGRIAPMRATIPSESPRGRVRTASRVPMKMTMVIVLILVGEKVIWAW